MALHVFNTLSRTREPFIPLEPGKVKMYVCGITPYDDCHLGHGRTYIVWDSVRRYLEFSGYQVTYVQNFTDVDDKILQRADQTGQTMEAVANTYIDHYFEDMKALGIRPADAYPRITRSMPQILELVKDLEQAGFAYPSGGDVYYRVRRFSGYGKLSGRHLEDLEAGRSERVRDEETARKEDPGDFALWKGAKPGEPAWPSAWGAGRPGWHIECSAMLREHLGESIDIHAGGEDLKFPHHENEIAQSEAVTGRPLARYWMHNGFVNIKNPRTGGVEKMSKSLGNFTTLRHLFETHPPMALRLLVLQTHYRSPIVFDLDALEGAGNAWKNLEKALGSGPLVARLGEPHPGPLSEEHIARFREAMDDDFNTPQALVPVFDLSHRLIRDRNIYIHEGRIEDPAGFAAAWRTLSLLARDVLGLIPSVEDEGLDGHAEATGAGGPTEAEIQAVIGQRNQARSERNWAEADRLRQQLLERGVVLVDHKDRPTTWRWVET